jgi:hypothetical protein
MFKQLTIQTPAGNLTYGYRREFRKWAFEMPGLCLLIACKGGEQGHKVAKLIVAALNRHGNLDGLTRSNINRLVA